MRVSVILLILSVSVQLEETQKAEDVPVVEDVPIVEEDSAVPEENLTIEDTAQGENPKMPEVDLNQFKEMESMMKLFTGMHCMMSMDTYMKKNVDKIRSIQNSSDLQKRMSKIIVNLYKECKNQGADEEGLEQMLKMIQKDPKKPDKEDKDIYQNFNLDYFLNTEDLELNEEEKYLEKEFKELETEINETKKTAQKNRKTKSSESSKTPPPKKSKSSAKPKKKILKKKSLGFNWGALICMMVVLSIVYFGWMLLFKEVPDVNKRNKKKKDKKKN